MNTMAKSLTAGVLGALLITTTLPAQADGSDPDPTAVALDMDTARGVALAEVPGLVVEAELDEEDGQVVWEFEVIAVEGARMEVLIDANTGELVSSQPDDDHDD